MTNSQLYAIINVSKEREENKMAKKQKKLIIVKDRETKDIYVFDNEEDCFALYKEKRYSDFNRSLERSTITINGRASSTSFY